MSNDTFDGFLFFFTNITSSAIQVQVSRIPGGFSVQHSFMFLLTCVACSPSDFSIVCRVSLCDSSNMKKNSRHARHDGLPV